MARRHWRWFALGLGFTLFLAACGGGTSPAATSETGAGGTPKEKTIVVGFTESKTGSLNVPSTRHAKGVLLWADRVNAEGGIPLSDGTRVKVKVVSYDDESSKERVQQLYTKLVTEDGADFLLAPYSSGLTAAAAVIAEQYGRVMVTGGAGDDETHRQGYTHVFQVLTPASRYLTGAVDLLHTVDPTVKKVAIVYENDRFSTASAEGVRKHAEELGYDVTMYESYDSTTADFGPFINKIQSSGAEAVLGGGHFQDGTTFARQLYEKKVPLKFIALLVAPPEPDFAKLGDAAYGIVGPSQWEPQVTYSPEAAKAAGQEWYGPSNDQFVKDYEQKYNEEPSYHSAGGFAAGLVLEKAIRDAGSLDTDKVIAALEKMNLMTFFGVTRFDTSAQNYGLQIGHEMVQIQWQKDGQGNLRKELVWPKEAATAEVIYPIR